MRADRATMRRMILDAISTAAKSIAMRDASVRLIGRMIPGGGIVMMYMAGATVMIVVVATHMTVTTATNMTSTAMAPPNHPIHRRRPSLTCKKTLCWSYISLYDQIRALRQLAPR